MKEKTMIQLPEKLQGQIIVIAHCCCAGSNKHAAGKGNSAC